ncbi:MAG: hypothetical protein M1816_007447 [Peltula sp. TS41687]|nr:MAG: hypothetical protein M1816_007447 [Peltula sp. TS41687]
MAQPVTRPNRNKNPGKKRRAAIKAAHFAKPSIFDPKLEKADAQEEEMEERPSKRVKVSHVKSGEGAEFPQPGPAAAAQIDDVGKPQKFNSRKRETTTTTTKQTREPEKTTASEPKPPPPSKTTQQKNVGDLDISQTHNIIRLNIISSSSINHKVSQILSHLSQLSFADVNAKPIMVEIGADAPVASKATSIVEITKSELDKQGAKWYQYTLVEPKIVQIPRKDERKVGDAGGRTLAGSGPAAHGNATATGGVGLQNTTAVDGRDDPMEEDKEVEAEVEVEEDDDDDDDDEPAFEEMRMETNSGGAGIKIDAVKEQKPKIRAIPRLVVYLSRVRSEKWKRLHGTKFTTTATSSATQSTLGPQRSSKPAWPLRLILFARQWNVTSAYSMAAMATAVNKPAEMRPTASPKFNSPMANPPSSTVKFNQLRKVRSFAKKTFGSMRVGRAMRFPAGVSRCVGGMVGEEGRGGQTLSPDLVVWFFLSLGMELGGFLTPNGYLLYAMKGWLDDLVFSGAGGYTICICGDEGNRLSLARGFTEIQ